MGGNEQEYENIPGNIKGNALDVRDRNSGVGEIGATGVRNRDKGGSELRKYVGNETEYSLVIRDYWKSGIGIV